MFNLPALKLGTTADIKSPPKQLKADKTLPELPDSFLTLSHENLMNIFLEIKKMHNDDPSQDTMR